MLVNTHVLRLTVLFSFLSFWSTSQVWTLDQCIDSALVNNAQLKMVHNKSEIVTLKNKEVKSNLIPKVNLNGDYKYFIELPYQFMPASVFGGPEGTFKKVQFGVPHNISANVTIQVPIYSSKVYGAIKKTSISKDLMALQIQKSEEQIYIEVTSLYRNAQLLLNKKAFLDSSNVNAEKMISNLESLYEQGLATSTDIKKVQLQLSILTSQTKQVESKTEQVLGGLKLFMNLSLDYPLEIESVIELSNQIVYEENESIDIQMKTLEQQMVESDISALKRSQFIPEFGAVGSYGTTGFGYDQAPNDFLEFYPVGFVGLKVSYLLFNGTVTHKQVAQKKIEYKNLSLEKEFIEDQNALEIQNARNNQTIALQQLEVNLLQIELAQEIFNDVMKLHENSLASTVDIIQAENELRQTRLNYLTSITECIKADIELKKLTGNLLK